MIQYSFFRMVRDPIIEPALYAITHEMQMTAHAVQPQFLNSIRSLFMSQLFDRTGGLK